MIFFQKSRQILVHGCCSNENKQPSPFSTSNQFLSIIVKIEEFPIMSLKSNFSFYSLELIFL